MHSSTGTAHAVRRALLHAHSTVIDKSLEESARTLTGMACGIVLACAYGDRLHLAHSGDVRVYRLHNCNLERLTRDHSVVEETMGAGDADAAEHPWRHVITQALGRQETFAPESRTIELDPGDRVLICTDGVWSSIEPDTISSCLEQFPADRVIDELEKMTLANGGLDNLASAAYIHAQSV